MQVATPQAAASDSPACVVPKCTIVGRVDRERLASVVGDLSGANVIDVGAGPVRLRTRYALGQQMGIVREYLARSVREAGYEPSIQQFMLTVQVPDLTGIAVSRGLDTVWTADIDGRVYRSTAAGGWAAFSECGRLGLAVNDLVVDHLGRLWAACRYVGTGFGALFVSTDGGATWTTRASGTQIFSLSTITFEDTQFGIAAGANATALHTGDGGATWDLSDPQGLYYQSFNGSATSGMFHDWIVSDNGYLFETTNLGTTWDMRWLTLRRLWDVDFSGETSGVIVGDSIALYTKDGGVTWNAVSVPAELRTVCMVDSLRVVAAGGVGNIFLSSDGGMTWNPLVAGCSLSDDVWRVAPAGRDRFWLSGRDLVRRVDIGIEDVSCMSYPFADTIWGGNISFRLGGKTEPEHEILLTAHYDSDNRVMDSSPFLCAPGADDNASGVAAVLECARALRDERTEKSIEFVLFDGEELGLVGSRFYARKLDPLIQYEAVVNLDMLGYEPNLEMTCIISGRRSAAPDSVLADAVNWGIASCFLPLSAEFVRGERLTSDHVAFWDVGIPGILICEGRRNELTPYYHSCGDVASTLNYQFLETCTKAALATIIDLAGLAPPDTIPRDTIPDELALSQNRPNPFASATLVSYALPNPAAVDLAVYDLAGRAVAVLERGWKDAGTFERTWDGTNEAGRPCASGIYFIRLRAGNRDIVRKAVLVR